MASPQPTPSPGHEPAPHRRPGAERQPAPRLATSAPPAPRPAGPRPVGMAVSPVNPGPIDRRLLSATPPGRTGQGMPDPAVQAAQPDATGDATRPDATGQVMREGATGPDTPPPTSPAAPPPTSQATPRPLGRATPPDPTGRAMPHPTRDPGPTAAAARRSERGPGLQLRPIVHVEDMTASVAFYQRLGAEVVHGETDGDWVLLQLGTTQLGLVARPPHAERGECTVELNFAAAMPLDLLQERLAVGGGPIAELTTDPDLGDQVEIRTPDGLLIKISQLEPDT